MTITKLFIYGDVHAPYHDKKAVSCMLKCMHVFKPDMVIDLGDFFDCYAVSSFKKDPRRPARLCDEVHQAEPVLRVGNLSARRDFTDVRDVARGYRLALDRGASGEVYNLCSGRSMAIEEIVQFFLDRATVPIEIRREDARMRAVDVPEFRGDASLARERLGWEPEVAIDRSLAEVLDEWRVRTEESAVD